MPGGSGRTAQFGEQAIMLDSPSAPRLGFAVKVLGRPELRSHDSRRWQNQPHLRVSLEYLRDILGYLRDSRIDMYRMASALAPYGTHPDHPQFHRQVEQSAKALTEVGELVRTQGVRLSFHPGQFVVLNTPDDQLARRSMADVELQASILEAMGLGAEAVVVTHVGGVYGDRATALDRFARRYERLSSAARRRLVVENDDGRFGVGDVLQLHRRTGIRVVFDAHHHRCYDPEGRSPQQAALASLDTWQGWSARPKLHFSSPRTDWGFRDGPAAGASRRPLSAHAEFIDPFAFIDFYRPIADWAPDVMLEAKAKDLALLQLRSDLSRYAPDLAAQFARSAPDQDQLREAQAA